MARERFSFDDTIEFDKDELKPNNDIHANHTGKFTFDDEVKEKKVDKPKKKKRKLIIKMIYNQIMIYMQDKQVNLHLMMK